ncbi:hypothetical protein DFP72DRAFT_847268 [Ephemerocybe angulata]|uniref:Uncharacterized protein n=1 Tax=Ephemerocybe angulata TaxID=980116 RepID=A0A8H6HYM7_9AGAR|nr:hypothetical protein DFP72DRAFT_847268 [Tulosesus angulatus]
MHLSLIALIPLTAFFSVVHAQSDYTHEAREQIDELATRAFKNSLLTTRQDLADLSTRDLVDELEDRLQRRGDRDIWFCQHCKRVLYSQSEAGHVELSVCPQFVPKVLPYSTNLFSNMPPKITSYFFKVSKEEYEEQQIQAFQSIKQRTALEQARNAVQQESPLERRRQSARERQRKHRKHAYEVEIESENTSTNSQRGLSKTLYSQHDKTWPTSQLGTS